MKGFSYLRIVIKLILDIGNTRVKSAIFNNKDLVSLEQFEKADVNTLADVFGKFKPNAAIVSSVIDLPSAFYENLSQLAPIIRLDSKTPTPITLKYLSPSLGTDRLAAALGSFSTYPDSDVLSIDCGTCIKYDFVNAEKEYLGGAISPGLQMRLKSLHDFTGKLPLVHLASPSDLIGNTTDTSILSGVVNGAQFEMEGMISHYRAQYPELKVILTGGDSKYFEGKFKNDIFVLPNLVLTGLNEILDYNVKVVL